MGAGDFPAGLGPAGFDPVAPLSPTAPRQVGAPLIHPATGNAIVQEDGTLEGVDSVDQAVALALRIALGTVGSSSTTGNNLRSIKHLGADLEMRVQQMIASALALLVNRGDVTLLSVVTERQRSGFTTEVTYRNNRTGETKSRTLRA